MRTTILAASVLAGSVSVGHAMEQCGDRDQVIASLSSKYSESHVASGFQSSAGLMEIWASDDDGTWTILLTHPNGQTCVVASGTHWLESVMTPVAGEPA